MGGKIIPRIRLTSAKDLVEVEAELGNDYLLNQMSDSPKTWMFVHFLRNKQRKLINLDYEGTLEDNFFKQGIRKRKMCSRRRKDSISLKKRTP